MEISGDIQYDYVNKMVDAIANMDFEEVLISENETDSIKSELQAIKFYLEGVAYTPIAIIGILGRFIDKYILSFVSIPLALCFLDKWP